MQDASLMASIQPLPVEVVHLIAAGEVIDSTAAVVRELAENALDAGATRIAISLQPEQWSLTVADNGCGMDLEDLQEAATAHSTSKIRHCDDLWKITSLGFRGEALHSLAQLAQLEILSRSANSGEGWRVVYNALGEPVQVETVAIAPGTIVKVSHLFGSWTVRRQGLPSPAQQLRAVQNTIHQIALCHPQVTWQVKQGDRPWFSLILGASVQEILPQLLRDLHWQDLQHFQQEIANTTDFPQSIELVLGLPDRCHRRRPDWVKVATNGRIVKSAELEQTILSAFGRTLPRDRYPVCFVHLHVSPEQIDWNRHPAKAQIYLHRLSFWQEQVKEAISRSLQISPATLPEGFHQQRIGKLLKATEAKGDYTPKKIGKKDEEALIELRAVAQVRNTYIVAEHDNGMWLVEQHIAHERVLYEQLCDRWQLVPLEPPIILSQLTSTQLEQLARLEMEVETFGDRLWAIRSVPEMLHQRDDCSQAILELSLGGDLQTAQVATACRSAIRNGTPLTIPEMQDILDRWIRTRNPRTCPHGRPIYLPLEETALARFFRRHWVIGKSHGI